MKKAEDPSEVGDWDESFGVQRLRGTSRRYTGRIACMRLAAVVTLGLTCLVAAMRWGESVELGHVWVKLVSNPGTGTLRMKVADYTTLFVSPGGPRLRGVELNRSFGQRGECLEAYFVLAPKCESSLDAMIGSLSRLVNSAPVVEQPYDTTGVVVEVGGDSWAEFVPEKIRASAGP